MPSLPDSGDFSYWFGHAQDKVAWEKMIKNLFKITYPRHNCNNYPNARSRARAQQQNHNQNSNPNSSPPKTPSPPRKKRNSPLTPPFFTPPHNLSNKMTLNDARKVLGVKRNSTSREIVLRFRILSRKYHPDKWSHTASYSKDIFTEKFKTIANARDTLLENM